MKLTALQRKTKRLEQQRLKKLEDENRRLREIKTKHESGLSANPFFWVAIVGGGILLLIIVLLLVFR